MRNILPISWRLWQKQKTVKAVVHLLNVSWNSSSDNERWGAALIYLFDVNISFWGLVLLLDYITWKKKYLHTNRKLRMIDRFITWRWVFFPSYYMILAIFVYLHRLAFYRKGQRKNWYCLFYRKKAANTSLCFIKCRA